MLGNRYFVAPINIDMGPHGWCIPVLTLAGEIEECASEQDVKEAVHAVRYVHDYDAALVLFEADDGEIVWRTIHWDVNLRLLQGLVDRPSMIAGVTQDVANKIKAGETIPAERYGV